MTRGLLLVGLAALLLTACADDSSVLPLTQVVLVVDTDLDVPTEIDEIEVFVTRPDGTVGEAVRLYNGSEQPPDTLTIVHDGGPLGPVQVSIVGRALRTFVVLRDVEFSFTAGASGVLAVDLLRECINVMCTAPGETCGAGGCISEEATPLAWSGEGDPIDVVSNTAP